MKGKESTVNRVNTSEKKNLPKDVGKPESSNSFVVLGSLEGQTRPLKDGDKLPSEVLISEIEVNTGNLEMVSQSPGVPILQEIHKAPSSPILHEIHNYPSRPSTSPSYVEILKKGG